MAGQPQLHTNEFFGVDLSNLVVYDPGGPSNYVIRRGDEFSLQTTLTFGGSLARLILCCLCWRICYCFDVACYEDGNDGESVPVDRSFCSPLYCVPENYPYPYPNGDIEFSDDATKAVVPANSLYVATYRITAVAKFYCRDEQHRAPYIAAFTDGPTLEITP
jgi:hypothetical protein